MTSLLAIDFGTSNTVAMLETGEGQPQPLLFGDSPLLPSAVFADAGGLLTGRDAVRAARAEPASFEPWPKRRVDDGSVLLGGRDIPVVELLASVLRTVTTEAVRVAGAPPASAIMTYPANWGQARRGVLQEAAAAAGLPGVRLLPEPAGAALYFSASAPPRPEGDVVVVYDFGGGTFDVCALSRRAGAVNVLAEAGLNDVGGGDLDMALFNRLGAVLSRAGVEKWNRLASPTDASSRRDRMLMLEDVRHAKEQLARTSSVSVNVPTFDRDVIVTREEFEALASPLLEQTVTLVTRTLSQAGIAVEQLAGVFLVGGSSRIPLVSTMLHRALGISPTVVGQPEQVVSRGALLALRPTPAPTAPVAATTATVSPPTSGAPAAPSWPDMSTGRFTSPPRAEPKRSRSLVGVIVGFVAAFLVLALGAVLIWQPWDPSDPKSASSGDETVPRHDAESSDLSGKSGSSISPSEEESTEEESGGGSDDSNEAAIPDVVLYERQSAIDHLAENGFTNVRMSYWTNDGGSQECPVDDHVPMAGEKHPYDVEITLSVETTNDLSACWIHTQ
ncbi:MAG: Hsp70 family protein [Stackebrandtia sp.]